MNMPKMKTQGMRKEAFIILISTTKPTIKVNELYGINELVTVFEVDEFNFQTGRAAVVKVTEIDLSKGLPLISVELQEVMQEKEQKR